MASLRAKVARILRQEFPRPGIVSLQDEDRIFGIVISSRFRGVNARRRVKLIDDVLEDRLTPDERKRIEFVIGVAPEEESVFDVVPGPGGTKVYRKTI